MSKEDGALMINAAARMIAKTGQAGAILVTGTDKIRSGYGNGDCVLLDFRNSVFALSDSTERHATASRELLERLQGSLAASGCPSGSDEWRAFVNEVYSHQNYRHKCTFSCVALRERGEGVELIALNGGDSSIIIINTATGEIEYMSKPDMYFAGRSRDIAHVSQITLEHTRYRIVICSDGLADVARISGNSLIGMLLDTANADVNETPTLFRRLTDSIEPGTGAEYDDAGVLTIDPCACLRKENSGIIMGGTAPHEESDYQKVFRVSADYDRWMGSSDFARHDGIMRSCGISIQ